VICGGMGQDQSSSLGESPSSSSSLPSFLANKAKGISPKPGRLAGKVIVVKSGNENDQSNVVDEDLAKLQEIPSFYPILRNALNIADVKDPPDVFTKFDHRPTLALCQRMQEHLAMTSEVVANEQSSLGIRIREIDYAVATMSNLLTDRDKSLSRITADLVKIKEINVQMMKITAQLQEVVPMANELTASLNNLMSPADEQDRIPLLNFSFILKPDTPGVESFPLFDGTEEQRVVDKSGDFT